MGIGSFELMQGTGRSGFGTICAQKRPGGPSKGRGSERTRRDTKKMARALLLREFIFAMRPKLAHLPTTFSGQLSALEST